MCKKEKILLPWSESCHITRYGKENIVLISFFLSFFLFFSFLFSFLFFIIIFLFIYFSLFFFLFKILDFYILYIYVIKRKRYCLGRSLATSRGTTKRISCLSLSFFLSFFPFPFPFFIIILFFVFFLFFFSFLENLCDKK